MKIILSRKGFDSSNGGLPSPFFEDGTMISLPIPSDDEDTYSDFMYDGMEYAKILNDLHYKGDIFCHADPDLDQTRRKEQYHEWVPAFGQIGASATYLKNSGVEVGDIFLFFGNFHFVENDNGTIRYVRNTGDFYKDNDIQIIWGYLQVGEIIDDPEMQKKLWWHPHSDDYRTSDETNVIFKAAETLSFDHSKRGAGLLTFDEKRVLTRYGCNKATWKQNDIYDVFNIYGNRKNSARDPITSIYYSGIWQELVLKESADCSKWAKYLLSDENSDKEKGNVLLTAECHNWGCHSPADWTKTQYILRKDGMLTIVTYVGEDITETQSRISNEDLSFIQKNIDKSIEQTEYVSACDGVAWTVRFGRKEFDLDYVYGTKLEKITNILEAAAG